MSIVLLSNCPAVSPWLESFTSGTLTIPSEVGISYDTVFDNFDEWYWCTSCPTYPPIDGGWCYWQTGYPAPDQVCLGATYSLPRMLKSGIWAVTITATLNTSDSVDPAYEPLCCVYDCHLTWSTSCHGSPEYVDPTDPWYMVQVRTDNGCCAPAGALTQNVMIGVTPTMSDQLCGCNTPWTCSDAPPWVQVVRGANIPGYSFGYQWASWDVQVSGTWDSDWP